MADGSLDVFIKDYHDFKGYTEELETAVEESKVPFSKTLRTCMENAVYFAREGDDEASQYWSKVVKDRLWEELHSGHWKDVPMAARRLYGMVMLLRGVVLTRMGKYREAMEAVDHGLLMGTPHQHLHTLARLLTAKLVSDSNNKEPPATEGQCSGDRDDAVATKKTIIKFRNYSHFKEETELAFPEVKRSKLDDNMTDKVFALELFSSRCMLLQTAYQPSLLSFSEAFMKTEAPVIVEGCMEQWPALRKWKLVERVSVVTSPPCPV